MQTLANSSTTRKPALKAFYATLYDTHGTITRVNGEYVFMSDEGDLTVVEMDMFPWIQLHGEIALADTQQLMDRLHGGAAAVCTSRQMEVR